MKERSQWLEIKVKTLFMLFQVPMMNFILMNERGMSYFIVLSPNIALILAHYHLIGAY
jgi:hypothetical protein